MLAARRIAVAVVAVLLALHYLDALVVDLPVGPLASDEGYYALLLALCSIIFARASDSRHDQQAWALIGSGALAWTLGDIYLTMATSEGESIAVPSPADAGYLLLPLFMCAGIVTLLRTHAGELGRARHADGVIVGLAVAAGCSAIFFDTVVHQVTGSPAEIIVNLSYPVLDILLVGVLAGTLAGMGWRLDPTLLLLVTGLTIFAVADSTYVVQLADGSYEPGGWLDAGWAAGLLLVGVAACGPPLMGARRQDPGALRPIVVPLGFASCALALLVMGCFTGLNLLAVVLAGACLAAVFARLIVTFQHNVEMLGAMREEALKDALTSLRNRRALLADLAEALFGVQEQRELHALVMLDMHGLKAFNDTLGRSAGDSLVQRLAGRLQLAAEGMGAHAYRTRGAEFALLVSVRSLEEAEELAERAAESVSENIEGFDIGCLHSFVMLGMEVFSIPEALRLANQRLQEQRLAVA